ncbi:MAG: HepT-like ribonuclease domain-containing protein [Prevotella sp.]|nr:HepT-like ribonuclease domain-containing protein [Prevotella sp.]
MKSNNLTILDRLNEIIESIELIEEWSRFAANASDFMLSPNGVMAFNACVMRLQVIGEDVGKLLRDESKPLEGYDSIPWHAIYNMRNFISHEYSNIDEDIVFSVIKEHLQPLKDTVERIISQLRNS